MQVILLEKVRNLGELGSTVSVRAGFGRNYLIPQRIAVPATPDNIKLFEQRRSELEAQAKAKLQKAEERSAELSSIKLKIPAKASDEGKLFGSVSTYEIIDALKQQNFEIYRNEVIMPNGPIREIGEHIIQVNLHTDVLVDFNVEVVKS